MTEVHDDPFREAAAGLIGIGQELTAVVAATQALQLRLIGVKPDKDAPLPEAAMEAEAAQLDLRTTQAASRFDWQPALADDWLAQASPVEAARAWAAALPYADIEPSANLALARTEARLGELHPEAMAHYNQLRASGRDPAEAMLESAPIFDTPSPTALSHDPHLVAAGHHAPQLAPKASATMMLTTHDLGSPESARLDQDGPELRAAPPTPGLDDPLGLAGPATPGLHARSTNPSHRTRGETGDAPDGPEFDDALGRGDPAPEAVAQEELGLPGPAADVAPAATLYEPAPALDAPTGPTVDPEGLRAEAPTPAAPVSEAARAAEIAGRTFPNAHEASYRVSKVHIPTNKPPQKRKVLGKVLRRGR